MLPCDLKCPVFGLKLTPVLFLLAATMAVAADFPAPYNTEKSTNASMSALESAAQAKVPPGFKVTLFAGEPDVQQPIGMALDSRGRLWIAENYSYSERPMRWDENLRDRILVFEDSDNDGRFDKRSVFWNDAQHLTSVATGFGGVWALCSPQLLFIPDRNDDGVPDGPPEAVLDGFDYKGNGHTVASGLKWGPDGWLYGRHGIQATSMIGPPGSPAAARVAVNVGIWRYHPTRKVFEVVAQGTTNPWGMDWNAQGEAFFINTVIGHLWHAIPGIHVKRMYGEDRNPHIYRLIDQHADHVHWDTREIWSDVRKLGVTEASSQAGGGHAHTGLMIYGGDNWPDEYRGRMFTINYHGRRLNSDTLVPEGSGYVGKHGKDFAQFADPWFKGIELLYGPDGGVYLSDWSDTGECHDNDGIHRTSGRIFKITYGQPAKPAIADVAKLSETELVKLLSHKNEWYARAARLTLQERAVAKPGTPVAHAELRRLFQESREPVAQLRALWALNAVNALDPQFLRGLLAHSSASVRVWAVRLLLDDLTKVNAETPAALFKLAQREAAAPVRLALASALQRLPLGQRAAVAAPLLARGEDAKDHNLPLMLWYGLEPLGHTEPQTLATLALDCALPETRLCLTRRVTEEIEKNPAPLNTILLAAAGKPAAFQKDILAGMNEALAGWRKAPKPAAWDTASAAFARSAEAAVRNAARDLSALFGDGRALDAIRALALDDKQDIPARRSALRALTEARAEGLRALSEKLFEVRDLAGAAANGLALSDDPAAGTYMINRFGRVQAYERSAVLSVLVSRPAWAKQLLAAVANGKISRQELTAYHARAIRTFNDPALTASLREVWGEFRDSDADKLALIAKWKARLTPAALARADQNKGREVFKQVCATCHKLYGEGAAIGPDLTGGDRGNLDYLLQNIADPSAVVPADYQLSTLTMKDERTLSGIVRSRTPKTITLQTLAEIVSLETAEVKTVETSKLSLMPDGLLEALDEGQLRDLLAYLMSKEAGK